ncbi:FHA domain-containing protein [Bifidobacterium gallicum]|uniref:FHA domain protein n=1 Tax=Bifidobacterium gallicum DSM 20093 = LMG 11596 TaxID=561180 RepID=D1NVH5_9BIFI|nr:FHA domain-containing protein [Bifidobacterium gallicum]EFA22826.1 FHA domain protein [Bifidobacterium gallicum DSM 20093 = LMG 11596]KFI59756.1 putative FHA domain protein [Bifidobacterium gallicum DSM 20093 = LMG 11596]
MKWVIRVDGAEVAEVQPGTSVEIGRKPIRPLADDGTVRVEIPDATRSMSKRHATFSVSEDGKASLRDLKSTNGTYIVREDGELLRLPEYANIALPDDPMRMQLGDVPMVFASVEDDDTNEDMPVANLFDYAFDDARPKENVEMSVDDILNLRAGEPTDIFNASTVRARATQLRQAEQQTFVPFEAPINPLPLAELDEASGTERNTRDLFADAQDIASGKLEEPQIQQSLVQPEPDPQPQTGERMVSIEELASARIVPTEDLEQAAQSSEPEPAVEPQPEEMPAHVDVSASVVFSNPEAVAQPVVQPEDVDEDSAPATAETEVEADNVEQVSQPEPQNVTDQPQADEELQESNGNTDNAAEIDEQYARFQRPQDEQTAVELEETQAFTPVFEPGSVFERVANGEFAQREQLVEAGGFTSDDARLSDDFREQHDMACYAELLPFLAMNPYLYDDLYEWLAEQGDADVDAALSNNKGYEDYRHAVGK